MFTAKKLMFLYAVTPVHMGAGTALGVIDNPIQREVHTGHPVFAGSGIKGALRDLARSSGWNREEIRRRFGPGEDTKEGEASRVHEHAGSVSFADAQLVAFPVRSLKEGYVYAASPGTLARLGRLAAVAGAEGFPTDKLPDPSETHAVVLDEVRLLAQKKLVLESYAFDPLSDSGALRKMAEWLAANALPGEDSHEFFRNKLKSDLVLVSDTHLAFFARNSTVVEPHVRIDDASGTADDGGLFFTENLPPESLMVSLAMASEERRTKGDNGDGKLKDREILKSIIETFGGKPLQIGGDVTTGRGQVIITFAGGVDANA